MNWAVDRKLERDRKDDPMDTDHAEWGPEDDSSWSWETSSPGDTDWEDARPDSQGDDVHDASAIGKGGKGKGKGKGAKSAGKGQHWTPSAINNKLGALLAAQAKLQAQIADCARGVKGAGKGASGPTSGQTASCNKCGGQGHLARHCESKVELRACGNCGKKGHLAAQRRSAQRVRFVETETIEEPQDAAAVESIGWGGGVLDCFAVGEDTQTSGS